MPSNDRSAESLRGAVHVATDCEELIAVAYYTKLLAAAEAREAGEKREAGGRDLGAEFWQGEVEYLDKLEAAQPSAAEIGEEK